MLALTDLPSLSSPFTRGAPTPARQAVELSALERPAFELQRPSAATQLAAVPLAALEDEEFAARFCAWRGASDRRYIFSVYEPRCCPAYFNAILLVAARGSDGRRRAVRVVETGIFPEPVIARERDEASGARQPIEFHLHLLARGVEDRRRVVYDLEAAGAYAPRS
jgi:hypothetical protein